VTGEREDAMTGADLEGADLRGADLRWADLEGAIGLEAGEAESTT